MNLGLLEQEEGLEIRESKTTMSHTDEFSYSKQDVN